MPLSGVVSYPSLVSEYGFVPNHVKVIRWCSSCTLFFDSIFLFRNKQTRAKMHRMSGVYLQEACGQRTKVWTWSSLGKCMSRTTISMARE